MRGRLTTVREILQLVTETLRLIGFVGCTTGFVFPDQVQVLPWRGPGWSSSDADSWVLRGSIGWS